MVEPVDLNNRRKLEKLKDEVWKFLLAQPHFKIISGEVMVVDNRGVQSKIHIDLSKNTSRKKD